MRRRYIIDVELRDDSGDEMWLGNDLRHLIEHGGGDGSSLTDTAWGKLSDPAIGVIVVRPDNTTEEEFERYKAAGLLGL